MNKKQLEEKIQKEAQKSIGHALNRNALKCGLEAFTSLFGPAQKPLEALGRIFLEREEIKKEVEVRYRFKDDEEFSRIFRIKLVKYVREKYKIPHISLYYY